MKAKAHTTKTAKKTAVAKILDSGSVKARNPTPLHALIGNKIRQFRITKGMSQQELGEKLGLTFQQIQKYEKGANRVDAARLLDIATVLDIDVMELYGENVTRRIRNGPTAHERYLATAEGHRLLDAMVLIDSLPLRRKIISLAQSIAHIGDEDAEDDDEAS